MKTPLVSVIIPAYNHEKYIGECLDSILSQDYSNFEIIILDDGSKDKTPEVIKNYAAKDTRIIFIQNEQNIGLTQTLNKALKSYVKGEYVIQIASDDKFCENRIRKQVEYMETHPQYGMAYSRAFLIDENSKTIGETKINPKTGWIFEELFLARFNITAYTCIYRNEIFKEVGYYDEQALIEDSDIWYKITKIYQVGFIDIYSAFYRRHVNNMSKRYLDMYNDTIRRLEKYKLEPKYQVAVRQANIHGFFNISMVNKLEAIKLLPLVISEIKSKFLWAGLMNLVGLSFFIKKLGHIQ